MPDYIIILSFILIGVFVILVSIKAGKVYIKKMDAKFTKNFSPPPTYEEIMAGHRKKDRVKSQEAFQLIEQIKDPILRKVLKDTLAKYRIGKDNHMLSGDIVINMVMGAIEYDKANPTKRSEDQIKRLKKLERLLDLCSSSSHKTEPSFTNIGRTAKLDYYKMEIINYKYLKSSEWKKLMSFLDALENTLLEYICFDCETVACKKCGHGHCLKCAAKKYKLTCLSCANLLGHEICPKCKTIKPAKSSGGSCIRCHELVGDDVCYECKTINPVRCAYCKDCIKCKGGYSTVCCACDDDD